MPHASQRERLREYERWLRRPSLSAVAARWMFGAQGAFLINGPLLRLPEELQLEPGLRLLDIGCGRGSLLRFLDGRVGFDREPVGVDFSASMLAQARRDEARAGHHTALTRGSATDLPYAGDAFDLVLCGYVVKHLTDDALDLLFEEIWRVLAPGGLAIVWEFAPTGRALLDAWNRRVLTTGLTAPRLRSSRALLRAAKRAGFPFAIEAGLRPFLLPPIPRASILIGRPPGDATR